MRTRHSRRRCIDRGRGSGSRRFARRGSRFVFLFGALLLVLLLAVETALNPLVNSSIAQQAQKKTAEIVNQTMSEWLSAHPQKNQLTVVTRSDSGAIQSVEANSAEISRIQSELNLLIQQRLAEIPAVSVSVPIGTLIGGNLLRERGPKITTKFAFSSSVLCSLQNEFSSAGINQTLHEVWLQVDTSLYSMIPTLCKEIKTTVRFCLVQDIIVGSVPSVVWSKETAH